MALASLAPALMLVWASLQALRPCDAQPLRHSHAGPQMADNNMNGEYVLSQTPGGDHTQSRFPKQFKDYPGGDVLSFDLYTEPITSLYSQVFWKPLPPIDLPKHIVDAFDGKGMAIIGWEADQVRKTSEGDVSVPLSVAYNHHYHAAMIGKGVHFEKVVFDGPDDPRLLKMEEGMEHGLPVNVDEHWMIVEDDTPTNFQEENGPALSSSRSRPTQQSFDIANGGEYRKTFKGVAPGYAYVVGSPKQFQVNPMQIDTWNRDAMDLTHPTKFVAGPEPRSSQAPPNASHSGLLECPLTTRITREYAGPLVVQQEQCKDPILKESECQRAAESLLQGSGVRLAGVATGKDPKAPAGCSIRTSASGVWSAEAFMNTLSSGGGAQKCGEDAEKFAGAAASLVEVAVSIDIAKGEVLLNLTGPSEVWFGVGFNARAMADKPWTIIVDGNGDVTERQLSNKSPGELLKTSVRVISSTTVSDRRKVVLARPLKGLTSKHYTFNPRGTPRLNFINAIGNGPVVAQHKSRKLSSLALLPVGTVGDCLCKLDQPFGTGQGRFRYNPTNQSVDVGSGTGPSKNKCPPQPQSDLLAQKNPTCDVRTYAGGVRACLHMWSLLDADQAIPWPDQPLTYHLKFRFFVQEFNASYHKPVERDIWAKMASPYEFDVPKCAPGIAGCEQQRDGTWIHTITGTFASGHSGGWLTHVNLHCHAATCLSVSLYRCPSGTEVCNGTNGELLCREEPIYGKGVENRFDEPGYILQPPCIWGSPEHGLEEPPALAGYVLGVVKTSNATYGHYGEMSLQQVLLTNSPPSMASSSAPAAPGRSSHPVEHEQKKHHGSERSYFNV